MSEYSDATDAIVAKGEAAVQIMHDFANGDASKIIQTESGPLDSLRKFISDNQEIINIYPELASELEQEIESRIQQNILLQAELANKLGSAYGQTTIAARLGMIVIPEQFGAVGNGVDDDTAFINQAIATGLPVEGLPGKVYAVSGNIQYSGSLFRLKNIAFKQLTPNAVNRRTILYTGNGGAFIERVTVDRNGNGTGGALNDAAGIWIAGATYGFIRNSEVFGNDYGSGIVWHDCNIDVLNNHVHDIRGGDANAPVIGDDKIQGLWGLRSTGLVQGNRSVNLTTQWTGQAATRLFTRGFAFSGMYNYRVIGNVSDNVDQGFDSSGGEWNRNGYYGGNIASNCYTWGFKFANTCNLITVQGNISYRAGNSGFVASAPTTNIGVESFKLTQDIIFDGNISIDSGFGGNWDTFNNEGPCGFRTLSSNAYPDYPRGCKFVNNKAVAPSLKMKFGFLNTVTVQSTGSSWNEVSNNDVRDAQVAPVQGFNIPFLKKASSASLALPANSETNLVFANTVRDGFSGAIDTVTSVIRRSGMYRVNLKVQLSGNATGTRSVYILINGVEPAGGRLTVPGNAADLIYELTYEDVFSAGSTIRFAANPGAVAVNALTATMTVSGTPGAL